MSLATVGLIVSTANGCVAIVLAVVQLRDRSRHRSRDSSES